MNSHNTTTVVKKYTGVHHKNRVFFPKQINQALKQFPQFLTPLCLRISTTSL